MLEDNTNIIFKNKHETVIKNIKVIQFVNKA